MMRKSYLALLIGALTLTACGDNGDPYSDEQPLNNGIVMSESDITAGLGAELTLYKPDEEVSNILWTQTSGAAVDLQTSKNKVLSFTVPSAGEYSFDVSYLDGSEQKMASINFTAKSGTPKLVARLGHSVVEGGNVSLRAYTDDSIDIETIVWKQTSGPSVEINESNEDKQIVIFDAPQVSQDLIVEFTAEAEDNNGNKYSDVVSVLVEDRPFISNDAYFDDDPLANVYPYMSDSPYKDTLVACTYSNQLTSSCKLGDLPILADDANNGTPTIDQIMDRVIVSHDWMAVNFRRYLELFDNNDDFKNLLRATTAIVLSYDVRPSFYWAATGAIYLDPNNLWLTPEERDVINEAPDYRADFGSDLQFVMPWRYVKDNDYVTYRYAINMRLTRDISEIKYDLADLLYHELAHANDYFPPAEWGTYSDSSRFLDAALNKDEISDGLESLFPLQSETMKGLAAVRFLGEQADATQKAYQPSDVAEFYKADISNGFYNYTNNKEDFGILFEELMMSIRYGVQRDTAVTSLFFDDGISGNDYVVSWGQRGRVAEPGISERAAYITERIMPEFDLTLINQLPDPILMTPGGDWWDNLAISPNPPAQLQNIPSSFSKGASPHRKAKQINTYQPHGRALPKH